MLKVEAMKIIQSIPLLSVGNSADLVSVVIRHLLLCKCNRNLCCELITELEAGVPNFVHNFPTSKHTQID